MRYRWHLLAALVAMTGAAGAVQAVQLESWDKKIDRVGSRFTVLSAFGNNAVLDRETQLVWVRAPSGQLRTYSGDFNSYYILRSGSRSHALALSARQGASQKES
jgi:hypothetical protein